MKQNGRKLFRKLSCHVWHFRTGQLQQAVPNLVRLVGRINKAREGGSKMFSHLGITQEKRKTKTRNKRKKNGNIWIKSVAKVSSVCKWLANYMYVCAMHTHTHTLHTHTHTLANRIRIWRSLFTESKLLYCCGRRYKNIIHIKLLTHFNAHNVTHTHTHSVTHIHTQWA